MATSLLIERAKSYLQKLCFEIPARRVGSQGNRLATDFFAGQMTGFGFEVEAPGFDCLDWTQGGAELTLDGAAFEAFVSPYTLGFKGRAPLAVASTVDELEAADLSDRIVLLRGEIAKEQVMPKDFPFYYPEEHQRIHRALLMSNPRAVITATVRNPEMAGAVYPFPLFEDGGFDIPSVFTTEEEGNRLAQRVGDEVALVIRANRNRGQGCNVVARKGDDPHRRVVLFAHIDAKEGAPGAIDNAAGVTVLLLLAELLAGYSGRLRIEIVAMNGEDYYSNPGEQLYLSQNAGSFEDIVLGVNVDGAGYIQGRTAFSLYGCPADLADLIHDVLSNAEDFVEGEPWYQGDHSLFIMNGRPALAITSERVFELMSEIVHSPRDLPEIVDPGRLVEIAARVRDLLVQLDRRENPTS